MSTGHVTHVVRSDSFAGVERYVADTASELHRRGWDVTVIGGDPARMRAELPAGVATRPGSSLAQTTRSLWRSGPNDVVHAHMTAAELPAAVLKRRLGGRLVVTRHFAAQRGASLLGSAVRPLIARRVDRQIAISRFVADRLGESSTVIHNGVRTSQRPDTARADVVVVLQRLEREKDTATAIRAWALSELGARGWRLEICGRGAEDAALRALARELGAHDSVDFRGFVDDARAHLAAASLLLATATAEPFGLAVIEAMAEGTPVVASDAGAHRETLGDAGVFFPAGDAARCARQLVALAGDPAARADLDARLRTRQQTEFSLDAHVRQLERVYAG